MSGHSSDSANPTNHGKRYTLLLDDWPRQGAAGGVASNFRHVANALHQRGQLYSVWIIDEHRPFWWPDTLEPDVPYRVVRINCNWGKYCRGGGRLGRTLVAVVKIAIQLTQDHAFFDRVVATNYYGFAGLYMHLPWAHQTMTRISTTTEQTNNYKTDSGPRLTNLTGRLFAAWEYRTIRSSQLLASHTVQHIKWLANRLKIPMKRFAYVPHGIPIERLAAVPWVPPRTLIFLGRLEHRKGCDVLIKALPELLAAVPDVRFVMIGRDMGDYESQLDLNFRTHYADRLIFTGLVSDQERDRWVEECYGLVSPARYESFGLTYLEAMARGKPVIGCTGSGSAEVIGAGGLVVAPGEVKPLVNAMIQLLQDPVLYGSLVSGALQQAQRFDVNETVRCLDTVFSSAEREQVV